MPTVEELEKRIAALEKAYAGLEIRVTEPRGWLDFKKMAVTGDNSRSFEHAAPDGLSFLSAWCFGSRNSDAAAAFKTVELHKPTL